MGVRDLWPILAPVEREISIADLEGKTLAVDLSYWVLEGLKQSDLAASRRRKPHLRVVFGRTRQLINYGVKLVFVIEGKAPDIKREELTQRSLHRKKYGNKKHAENAQNSVNEITERMSFHPYLNECKELLESLGIPCITGAGEAEAMCAFLNSNELVDGCITKDSDALLYGAKVVYKDLLLKKKTIKELSMNDVQEQLGYDRKKLVAFALLLGCDYSRGIPSVGKSKAVELMDSLKSEEDVLERFKSWKTDNLLNDYNFVYLNKQMSVHCNLCGHLGSQKMHASKGCEQCGSTHLCTETQTLTCACEWHRVHGLKEKLGPAELSVRLKAQKDDDFPSQKVIDEYLKCKDIPPIQPLAWQMPNWLKFQDVAEKWINLTGKRRWECFLCLLTKWHLTIGQNSGSNVLKPQRIIKNRKVEGKECYEIEWIVSEKVYENVASETHITVENKNLFSTVYSSMAEQFDQEKQLKQGKSAKPDENQRIISEMMPLTSKKNAERRKFSEDESEVVEIGAGSLTPKASKIPTPSKRHPRTPKKPSGVARSLSKEFVESHKKITSFFEKNDSHLTENPDA